MPVPCCDAIEGSYCAAHAREVDRYCHDLHLPSGKWVLFEGPDGRTCYCVCGGGWTRENLVLGADGDPLPFALAGGEAVLAAGLSLEFAPAILEHVAAVHGRHDNAVLLRYAIDGAVLTRVVHADTPLLTARGNLLPASRLQLSDCLVSAGGDAVAIERIVWGAFEGAMHDLATVLEPPDGTLDGHLLVIDGTVTGDYAVQLFASPLIEPGRGGFAAGLARRPSVGSPEWEARNGGGGRGDPESVVDLAHGTFYAAAFLTTEPPPEARSLLSGRGVPARAGAAALPEDLALLERTRAALGRRAARAGLNLLIDWYATGEDALTWRDADGHAHLLIQGGLLRRGEPAILRAAARLIDRLS